MKVGYTEALLLVTQLEREYLVSTQHRRRRKVQARLLEWSAGQ